MDEPIDEQVARLQDRVKRLEALLKEVVHNLPRRPGDPRLDLDAVRAGIQQWVTDYVSLRLQQLVPETCEPVPAADPGERPVGRNNSIRPSGRMVIDMMQAPEHRLPDAVLKNTVRTPKKSHAQIFLAWSVKNVRQVGEGTPS